MRIMKSGPMTLCLCVWLASAAGSAPAVPPTPAAGAARPALTTKPKISETGYTSAMVCGSCHSDIYNSWKRSMHASSLSDPVFEVALMQALKVDEKARTLCLGCHAPTTLVNKDVELAQGITREGVTCDFCHTVTEVHVGDRNKPYVQELGRVKRSSMRRANSPVHEVAYSELHTRAEFCGACHNYDSESGVPVMSTYTEWQAGPYSREGVACQDCHMARSEGRVVAGDVKPRSGPFNLHDLIHNSEQLSRALKVKVDDVTTFDGGVVVFVEVMNVGSGHKIPTGLPNREVVLKVELVTTDGVKYEETKSYRKVLAGEDGKPLVHDYEAFLKARSVLKDDRLAPRERRRETFRFQTSSRPARVTAVALYQYAPMLMKQVPMVVTLARDSLQVGSPTPWGSR